MSSDPIMIGELSDQIGVKVETIRYYEKIGLMPQPRRTEGGHRIYELDEIERLSFIKRGRELGFSLGDIRGLLGIGDQRPTCGEVLEITEHHLREIESKIQDLQNLERILSVFAKQCKGGRSQNCPVIDALSFNC